ncbi:MAG: ribonuclease PH [Candidatus Hydrogenedentes bacterium]|nr:ribonuclease PH [Candidatus Hydrogenedentota bacterium]
MTREGRTPRELRPVAIVRNYTKNADGSVLISFGDTRVLCTASIEDRVPAWLKGQDRGWLTAEYAMLPASASEGRISRDATQRGRAMEISRLIGRSLRSIIDLERLGERQITLDCDVLQADGGTRTAAITGAYVSLHDAVSGLLARDLLAESPITGQCAAISVGLLDGESYLDLCYAEDAAADVDLNLVMKGDESIIEVQATAEGHSFNRAQLDEMLELGRTGIFELLGLQHEAINSG